MAVHPIHPEILYAGTQNGLYKSRDRGDQWTRLDMPATNSVVWSLMFRPSDADVVYAGMAPAQIFRSIDRGESWQLLPIALGPDVCEMGFDTRIIAMAANPANPPARSSRRRIPAIDCLALSDPCTGPSSPTRFSILRRAATAGDSRFLGGAPRNSSKEQRRQQADHPEDRDHAKDVLMAERPR